MSDIKNRLRHTLSDMRKEGFNIPRNVKLDDFPVDEKMSRIELRETIAMMYNYITPQGVELDGLDALSIMNNTVNKQRGRRY